ncbi:MAG: MBL fold metallo-hydrolase [Hydrogenoanaerobacterium sp.]
MKLHFLGADREVTGSCHYLEACGKNILVDCGMEQGPDEYENQELPIHAAEIDYVLLTHSHIDHSGKLPLLYKNGFRGEIHTTGATSDLCGIMLKDSAHIQMFEAEWRNRKAKRAGGEEFIPLYDMEDAIGALECFVPHKYAQRFKLCEGIEVSFTDVGHLLGSAAIELWVNEDGNAKKLVFSGDVGNLNQPLIRDPQTLSEADYVIIEATYGDRSHGERPNYIKALTDIIQRTLDGGGNLVIPSFAVGRTQELLYFIRKIKEDGLVKGHGCFPVYVDSPLAVEATNIFNINSLEYFDGEAQELVRRGINPISFDGLNVSVTSDDSKAINFDTNPKVIISASGMCEAGRIKHHLKHNLWRKESTVLFVGYQAVGTLGRSILEGAEKVKLFGDSIEVCAKIERLEGISGHADKAGLLSWLQAFSPAPTRVFVVHGDEESCESFTACLNDEYHYSALAPYTGGIYDLISNTCLDEGTKTRIKKAVPEGAAMRHVSEVFTRLVAAGRRLAVVISHNEGLANKELARFADQINSLCDKWDR